MGAAVGRDAEAVKQGLACLAARDSGSEAFFRRLQSPELRVQSALLVLRQCAVPKLNFLLRCWPPECIAEQAAHFDHALVTDACDKLELRCDERTAEVEQRLRLRLKDGGFGLKSAAQTSPCCLHRVSGRSSRHGCVRSLPRCCLPAACGHAAARLASGQPDAAARRRAWARARVQAAACLRLVLLLLLRLCSLRPVLLPAKLHQRPGQQSRPRGLPDCSPAS